MTLKSADRTTAIEWTQHTWNPFVGCTIHTAGCTNCYAMSQAARILRMGGSPSYEGTVKVVNDIPVWTGKLNRATPAAFNRPLHIKKPSMIFVNSMSDFFHDDAERDWQWDAFRIMCGTPHIYQVLTKRPENIQKHLDRLGIPKLPPNVWIGATVENSQYKHRIDELRQIKAAVRFLSCEPLLGPLGNLNLRDIHWVIAGGESGKKARPMHIEWVRELRNYCVADGIPFFFKQWGEWAPPTSEDPDIPLEVMNGRMYRVGKRKSGRLLDGKEWSEFPRRSNEYN